MSAKETLQQTAASAPVIIEARQGLHTPSTVVIKFPKIVDESIVIDFKVMFDGLEGFWVSDRALDRAKCLMGCSAIGLEIYEGIVLAEVTKILTKELVRLGFDNVVLKYPTV
jgi:hypothetical protein